MQEGLNRQAEVAPEQLGVVLPGARQVLPMDGSVNFSGATHGRGKAVGAAHSFAWPSILSQETETACPCGAAWWPGRPIGFFNGYKMDFRRDIKYRINS